MEKGLVFAHAREVIDAALKNAHRKSDEVTIVSVTKYFDTPFTKEFLSHGFYHLGENRVNGLLEKQQEIKDERVVWHFIGNLQRKKVKKVINHIDVFHALDSFNLAIEIQKRRERVLDCFVEVNVSGEESKRGFSADELEEFLKSIEDFDKINVIGLMSMAPKDANKEECRKIFSTLRELMKQLRKKGIKNAPLTEMSAGMSRDFTIALEEGSTFVRIGSLFKTYEEENDGFTRQT